MDTRPLFSVIIPVYNAEKYLAQCVDSLLDQDFSDFELLLVDDGSPDGSGVLCDEYAAKDERVQVIHQANAGPTPARRRGLERARGEYICFVDADDWVKPAYFRTIKSYIDRYDPDMVLFDVELDTGPAEEPIRVEEGLYDKARLEAEVYPYMLLDIRRRPFGQQLFPGYLVTKVGRRELIAAHYLQDDRITIFEDVAMSYECLLFSDRVYISREPLYIYRQVAQSNLNHYRPHYLDEVNAVFDYLTAHLSCHGPQYAVQVNAFCARRLIGFMAWELKHSGMDVRATARALKAAEDKTGFVRKLTYKGLNWPLKLFLLIVKLRLYLPAALLVKLRM